MVQVNKIKLPVGGTDPSDRNADRDDEAKAAKAAEQARLAAKANAEKEALARINPFDGLIHNNDGSTVDPATGQPVVEPC